VRVRPQAHLCTVGVARCRAQAVSLKRGRGVASFMPMARSRSRKSKRRGVGCVARIPRGSVEALPCRPARGEIERAADSERRGVPAPTGNLYAYYHTCDFAPPVFLRLHTRVYTARERLREACFCFQTRGPDPLRGGGRAPTHPEIKTLGHTQLSRSSFSTVHCGEPPTVVHRRPTTRDPLPRDPALPRNALYRGTITRSH